MYTGHRAEPSFRFPQQLAKDTKGKKISAYAKQPALTRFSYASQRTGKASKTQRELAKLSGMAVDTVSRKLKELEKAGYIAVKRHRAKRDPETGRITRSASEYTCIVPQKGFIMIPYRYVRKLEEGNLHGATVAVFLYIYRQIRKGHAYPQGNRSGGQHRPCRPAGAGLCWPALHTALQEAQRCVLQQFLPPAA